MENILWGCPFFRFHTKFNTTKNHAQFLTVDMIFDISWIPKSGCVFPSKINGIQRANNNTNKWGCFKQKGNMESAHFEMDDSEWKFRCFVFNATLRLFCNDLIAFIIDFSRLVSNICLFVHVLPSSRFFFWIDNIVHSKQ